MVIGQNKPVLIIGAARQGLALARFLANRGVQVILNDRRSVDQMKDAVESMQGVNVEWVLGDHPLQLLDRVDTVCLSGGVPLTLPIVAEAQKRGLHLTNDSQIFIENVNAKVVGITGSAGKTTTTTLVGRMAQAGNQSAHRVWIGGNIGQPLVEYLDEIQPDDLVVLELSSFQLEQMTVSPQISAVLNITPNHLDRHGTMEAYIAAKAHILDYQNAEDIAILNREDSGSLGLQNRVHGKLMTFGLEKPAPGIDGTYLQDGHLMLQTAENQSEIMPQTMISLRGMHNVVNVLAACAIVAAAGLDNNAMRAGVVGFGGVAHRLELVRELNGISWYNCSISTAPERTMADLHAFTEPIVLLLGGRDKHLPWEDLSRFIHSRVDHVVVFGEAAPLIQSALGKIHPGDRLSSITITGAFKDALKEASAAAQPGDVVLLSPGCTSYDEFRDFEARGQFFREWVNQLS